MIKNKYADQKRLSILISIFGIGIVVLNMFLFIEYSIAIKDGLKFATSLGYALYLIFFLTVIYLIYSSDINRLFMADKRYEDIISNLSSEKDKLEIEINSHKKNIQSKMECIISLEQKINRIGLNKPSINLEKFYTTAMESNVIRELCLQADLTNKEIALILGLKTGTVKQHMNKVFKKLDICSRQELVERCSWNFNK
jgi:DNA-binding CsgD family transcriptional regulator